MGIDRLTAARRLVQLGFSVIPIGDDKKPVASWKHFQQARPTDDNLSSWFGNGHQRNIGIVTGKVSGVVVVDTDSEAAEAWVSSRLPATPMQVRTARGLHRYYRHPGTEIRNGARLKTEDGELEIDVRGDGGYVVGPGSRHPSGVDYQAPSKWPDSIASLPVFDPTWLETHAKQIQQIPTEPRDGIIPRGRRNDSLARLAGAMRRQGASQAGIRTALQHENGTRCQPPLPEPEVNAIAGSVGRRYTPAEAPVLPAIEVLDDVALVNRPTPNYLVGGRLPQGVLANLYAQPSEGKTFLAVGLGLAKATGHDWLGAAIDRPGPCAYLAAEGAGGIGRRVRSWKVAHHVPLDERVGLLIVPTAINLMSGGDVNGLLDAVRDHRPELLIIDTLARCMVGGDENSARDMGIAIASCDRIRAELGCALLILHHSTKSGGVERGSGALRGACDTVWSMAKADDLITLACEKQKEDEQFASLALRLTPVPETKSCIFRRATEVLPSSEVSEAQRRLLQALTDNFTATGATGGEWQEIVPEVPRRTFYRAKKALVDRGFVATRGGRYVAHGRAGGLE